ncbi:MAG: glycoside hydrolase family 30 beta sandwich domain-containing protein [Brevundimonas sp.]|uniref:glycoside hydrolase family 30 protein n=1 Tax=Brevundimonas sp. TaxID=1871086 RepID=UPI002ABCD89A|nr:glycoside hydrolase family 30 beta sandwich domain-containing protein [Brevundimonas sp.]MDZ4111981.1 glycoside hydrolase family 30 beta sandwich domain-containing protein [Brevundimonas sp.]
MTRRISTLALRALIIGTGLAVLGPAACAGAPADPFARIWMTSGDRSRLLTEQAPVSFEADATLARPSVVVDADQQFQEMVGFGAAITDASAILIQTGLDRDQRDALMRELFGREEGGLGFSFTRVTIGASDFSLDHYSLADAPDPALASFSTRRMEEYVFPTVRQAVAINPDLKVMASPWSAPGWMKTTGSMIQGQLKPEFYPVYAEYFRRYIDSAAARGVPTDYLSIQNEPDFEPDSYPGMRWAPQDRAAFVAQHLGPLLRDVGIETRILDWDHNWDQPQQPLAVLADERARPFVAGVAWHCYDGDPAAQSLVRDAWPDKDVFFTECSGGEWAPDFADSFTWTMKNLIIGSVEHWARGVLMWNLALDESHGPHAGGCGDCRGVVMIDRRTGAVQRNQEYYAFGHASRFVRPGARRISSVEPEGLQAVAFVNPDGGRVLIVLNEGPSSVAFEIRESGRGAAVELPPRTAATYVWEAFI